MMNPNVNRSQLVHIDEAAKALGLSTSNMYRLARDHRIPSVRIGKRWLFDVDTIIKTMLAQTQPPSKTNRPVKAPTPERLPQSPEQIISHAKEAIALAADAVHQAAKVMQMMDQVRVELRREGRS
jgi:excisionase family DNA binding protein